MCFILAQKYFIIIIQCSMSPTQMSQNMNWLCFLSLYSSAFCEVDQCPLRQGLTPPELKPFSPLTGLQAASRDAGQCLRQGHLCWPHKIPASCFLCVSVIPLLCFPRVLEGRLHYTLLQTLNQTFPPVSVFISVLLLSTHLSRENKLQLLSC